MSIELPGLEPHEVAALIPQRPILVGYRGSRAHGMYVPPSEPTGIDDIDIQAVYIPDLVAYFGSHLDPPRGKDIKLKEYDLAAYEVRHMVGLLCNGNPNVLSLLWTSDLIHVEREGQMLIDARRIFATKRAYHSFGGYAHGQLKRMTSFRESIDGACGCSGKFHSADCAVAQERGRGSSKRFATGFMGEKRKQLVAKFGYDAKNAAHLLRLLKMGCEFLRTGDLIVDRREAGDVDWLLAVKRGEWALWDIQTEAEKLFGAMREARDASPLPEEPDMLAANLLLMDILSIAHNTTVSLRANAILTQRFLEGAPKEGGGE